VPLKFFHDVYGPAVFRNCRSNRKYFRTKSAAGITVQPPVGLDLCIFRLIGSCFPSLSAPAPYTTSEPSIVLEITIVASTSESCRVWRRTRIPKSIAHAAFRRLTFALSRFRQTSARPSSTGIVIFQQNPVLDVRPAETFGLAVGLRFAKRDSRCFCVRHRFCRTRFLSPSHLTFTLVFHQSLPLLNLFLRLAFRTGKPMGLPCTGKCFFFERRSGLPGRAAMAD